MENNKWRFPASNFGERKGISSGDAEAFKKSPYSAFAREIIQNSIDARYSDENPTRVEFCKFKIRTSEIPGINDLKSQIKRCRDFWKHKSDYVKEYKNYLDTLNQQSMECLRVSDMNTTGLIGINSKTQKNNHFLALTKGTGVSEKTNALAGGSKGVGKNASFLMSNVRTVFYSTNAIKDLEGNTGNFFGSIGVAELVSGYIDDSDIKNGDYTQGTGYYSRDSENDALLNVMDLDPNFKERKTNPGTDIFIIAFNGRNEWKYEVINSILDSFMSTIIRGELEVCVDDIQITRDTVSSIVYDDSIIDKRLKSSIISQYLLLTDGERVKIYDIETDYGNCELYILSLSKEEDYLATHKCTMIRHPLMKIKDESLGNNYRVSAMCIIEEGELGKMLREIENPQHIDWEPKRIGDLDLRREYESIIKSIRQQIKEKVQECLQLGDETPLDPNGAGDWLPDIDTGDSVSMSSEGKNSNDSVSVTKPKMNDTLGKNAYDHSDNSDSLTPDIGSVGDEPDGDVSYPSGSNDNDGGEIHGGEESANNAGGDNIVMTRKKLNGVKYKVISIDKDQGKLRIIFIAPIDYDNCYLNLIMLDDNNTGTYVNITSLTCNSTPISSSDSKEFGPFKIKINERVVLDITTDLKGYFGSEVKIICK